MLAEGFLTSNVGSAITDTDAVQLVPYASSISNHFLSELDICNNHASVSTALDIMSGDNVLWTLPAPAGKSRIRKFDPPLKLPAGSNLSIKSHDAASIGVSARYLRGIIDPVQPEPPAYSWIPEDLTESGVTYLDLDGSSNYISMPPWILKPDSIWTLLWQGRVDSGVENGDSYFNQLDSSTRGLWITYSSGDLHIYIFDTGSFKMQASVPGGSVGTAYNWAVLWDGTTRDFSGLTVLRNNVEQTITEQVDNLSGGSNTTPAGDNNQFVGRNNTKYIDISIRDIARFNSLLSAENLTAFNEKTSIDVEPEIRLKCDEGSGTLIANTGSGSDGDATLNGSTDAWTTTA